MYKRMIFMSVASVLLATSCSENQDVIGENLSNLSIQINLSVGHASGPGSSI